MDKDFEAETENGHQENSSGTVELGRSVPEKRRSDLTLHLANGPHASGKPRTRPVLPTSGTSPSLSMIASLISLENYRSTKEPQQQQPIYSGANVPAQVFNSSFLDLLHIFLLRLLCVGHVDGFYDTHLVYC